MGNLTAAVLLLTADMLQHVQIIVGIMVGAVTLFFTIDKWRMERQKHAVEGQNEKRLALIEQARHERDQEIAELNRQIAELKRGQSA